MGSSPTLSALGRGGILKLVKRTVLKTVRSVKRHGGSNPSTSALEVLLVHEWIQRNTKALTTVYVSLVLISSVSWLSLLYEMWVCTEGLLLSSTEWTLYASVAQLVEYWSPKPVVVGSNPSRRAAKRSLAAAFLFHFLELTKVWILLPLRRDGVVDSTTKNS